MVPIPAIFFFVKSKNFPAGRFPAIFLFVKSKNFLGEKGICPLQAEKARGKTMFCPPPKSSDLCPHWFFLRVRSHACLVPIPALFFFVKWKKFPVRRFSAAFLFVKSKKISRASFFLLLINYFRNALQPTKVRSRCLFTPVRSLRDVFFFCSSDFLGLPPQTDRLDPPLHGRGLIRPF